MMTEKLTHIDEHGAAKMVDVADKAITKRSATASAIIEMQPKTLQLILEGGLPKGDCIPVARTAGIMAAKRTHDLIPLCHPLALSSVDIVFHACKDNQLEIKATVRLSGKTGVEMEALTAASISALTIYDMIKAIEKTAIIKETKLVEKLGGKSGHFKI